MHCYVAQEPKVTCIDDWMHSRVVPVIVLWITSVFKTWLSYTTKKIIESSCAGNKAIDSKKRIRTFVRGIADTCAIVLALTSSSGCDRRTTSPLETDQISMAQILLRLLPAGSLSFLVYLCGFFTRLPLCSENDWQLEDVARIFGHRLLGGCQTRLCRSG